MESNKTQTKKVVSRLLISLAVIVAICLAGYFIFRHFGITNLSREQIQDFIKGTGVIAPLVYLLVTFAQVTLIPIPGAVTIIAGSYLFGFWWAFLYSYIGTLLGSIASFALGRLIGRPYVNWVVGGKEKADEWVKKLKGRENVFLFFAFLLPLFPDDILCAVAGALPIRWRTFIIMQLITRFTSVGATLLFMSGQIIPFHGWGIVVLIVLGVLAIGAFIISLKYSEQINKAFSNFIDKISNKLKRKNKEK
ncbi:MAG: TVP38/TMEM64 family protein [Clostridiales bacterium]|nr:TVP38/TMEM64 family protein [Clostridiales bacterium]